MEELRLPTAEFLISHAFQRATMGHYLVMALRRMATIKTGATDSIENYAAEVVAELKTTPGMAHLFSDLNPLRPPQFEPDRVEKDLIDTHFEIFRTATDAACLIFLHSVADGVALQLTQASIAAEPHSWLFVVRDRTIRVGELERLTAESLQAAALRQYSRELSHQSLPEKVDRLFQVCKPKSGKLVGGERYRYSRERIARLDQLRHELVHGTPPANAPHIVYQMNRWRTAEDDLDFLATTTHGLVIMVAKRHSIEPNPLDLR